MGDSTKLTDLAIDYVMSQGACAAGISTNETLAGGPPSTDFQYVLSGARSSVTFAVPLDPEAIERYLSKKDHRLLTRSGVVVQHPNGSLEAVSPEVAERHLAAMTPEQRACYEEVPSVPGAVG
jgi:hypothetical protein